MSEYETQKQRILRAMANPNGIVAIIENFDNGDFTVGEIIDRKEFFKLECYIREDQNTLGDILFGDK